MLNKNKAQGRDVLCVRLGREIVLDVLEDVRRKLVEGPDSVPVEPEPARIGGEVFVACAAAKALEPTFKTRHSAHLWRAMPGFRIWVVSLRGLSQQSALNEARAQNLSSPEPLQIVAWDPRPRDASSLSPQYRGLNN